MNSKSFDVPYPIGTYLTRNENGVEHLDQVEKYVLSNEGLFVILMLDVKTNPRLSVEISINDLLEKWEEDKNNIHFSGDIGTKIMIGLPEDIDFHFSGDIGTRITLEGTKKRARKID